MTSTKGVSAKHNAKLAFDVWDSMKEKTHSRWSKNDSK